MDKLGRIGKGDKDVGALKIREVCENFFDAYAAGEPLQCGLDRLP